MRFRNPMLKSDLCNYSDAYIVVKGARTAEGTNASNGTDKELVLKNNFPFRSCISKINNTYLGNFLRSLDIPFY